MTQVSVLPFTGERFTPESVREIHYEHLHRYAFARALVADKHVLDCACGEGYGSALLASAAQSVVGVDIDGRSIAHAQARYGAPINLKFQQASVTQLPFERATFDVIVSFETIEHLAEQAEMLAEFRRVLKPNGILVLSSPDRDAYNQLGGEANEFHVRELNRLELADLLKAQFSVVQWFGQRLLFQSAIWPLVGDSTQVIERSHGAELGRVQHPSEQPIYHLVIAGAQTAVLPAVLPTSWFADSTESVYAHYQAEIRNGIYAAQRIGELKAELASLTEAYEDASHRLKQFELTLVEARWRNYMGKRR